MLFLHENPDSQPTDPLLSRNEENLNLNIPKTVKVKIMKTPCDHLYHIPCLKKWLEQKLECPTCRKVIPALE